MSALLATARGIAAHLQRMERDPALNTRSPKDWGPLRFEAPTAEPHGSGVGITYRRGGSRYFLGRPRAEMYLHWLDYGANGTHFDMEATHPVQSAGKL